MKNEPENEDPQAEDGEQVANLDLTDEQADDSGMLCDNPNRCPNMKPMKKPAKFNNEHCDVCDRTQRRG